MAEVVEAAVQKWGNGLAIRLTQRIAKAGGVQEGTRVVITAEQGTLLVEPAKTTISLDERLARFDPQRHGGEEMAFAPVGAEV